MFLLAEYITQLSYICTIIFNLPMMKLFMVVSYTQTVVSDCVFSPSVLTLIYLGKYRWGGETRKGGETKEE